MVGTNGWGRTERRHLSYSASCPRAILQMVYTLDEWTIKTPNPKCRLFSKIDLLTDFAALCLTDFIDSRFVHSWLVFSTHLVNCCSPGRRNYTRVMCSVAPLPSLWPPPPPFQTKCTVYAYNVWLWLWGEGGGGIELCCRPYSAGVLHSVTD